MKVINDRMVSNAMQRHKTIQLLSVPAAGFTNVL